MTKIKLKLEIDLTKADQTNALNTLLCAIGGQEAGVVAPAVVAPKEEAAPAEPLKEEKPKKKRRSKAEIAADELAAEAVKEAEAISQGEPEAPEEDNLPDRTELRALFAKVLNAGNEQTREACLGKLKALGAASLPTLKDADLQGFEDFLNDLSK